MSKQLQAKTTEKVHFAKLQLRLLSAVRQNEALNQINQLNALRQSVFFYVDASWRAFMAEICLQANLTPFDWNQIRLSEAMALCDQANRASPELNQIYAVISEPGSWLKQLLEMVQVEISVVVGKPVEKVFDTSRIPLQSAAIELDDKALEQWLIKFEDLIMTMRDTMLEW